jgi:hypothetical protein
MRCALIPLILPLALIAGACATDAPAGPDDSASLDASRAGTSPKPRPAGGSCVTTVAPAGFDFPHLTITIDGVCHLRHLGRATMHATQVIDVTTGLFSNETIYIAANGDELHTTFAGVTTSPPGSLDITFDGTETFVGGTGRFASATGTTTAQGSATLAADQSGVGKYRMEGWITF